MSSWKPRVAILGAGAIGSFYGGVLARGGLDVVFVDPWREHIERIQSSGLKVLHDGQEWTVSPRAFTSAKDAGPTDVVIVQCKALHTEVAVAGAKGLFGKDTVALTFQNGMGNEEVIGSVVGMDRVLGGLTINGANIVEPGIVKSFSLLPSYIGELKGGTSERAQRIADAFSSAGFPIEVSKDVVREKWKKLFANVALSAASTITKLNTREMASVPEMRNLLFDTIDEALSVARAAGHDFTRDEAQHVLLQIIGGGSAAENRSSAAIDLRRGRKTEVDFISGAIVRLGEKHGVPTPISRTMVALVKALELNCT